MRATPNPALLLITAYAVRRLPYVVRATVAGCPTEPFVHRDDIGASARLVDAAGTALTHRFEVSGGTGRGHMGHADEGILHFGLGEDERVERLIASL